MNKSLGMYVAAAVALGASLLPMAAQAQVTPSSPAPARIARQNQRIRQGVQSGNLTPLQARRLSHRDVRTMRRARMERRMNGGYLTAAQHARMENRLNRTSNAIAQRKNP